MLWTRSLLRLSNGSSFSFLGFATLLALLFKHLFGLLRRINKGFVRFIYFSDAKHYFSRHFALKYRVGERNEQTSDLFSSEYKAGCRNMKTISLNSIESFTRREDNRKKTIFDWYCDLLAWSLYESHASNAILDLKASTNEVRDWESDPMIILLGEKVRLRSPIVIVKHGHSWSWSKCCNNTLTRRKVF